MKNIIRSSLAIILAAAGNIAANGEEPEFIKITPWAEASLSDMSAPAAGRHMSNSTTYSVPTPRCMEQVR